MNMSKDENINSTDGPGVMSNKVIRIDLAEKYLFNPDELTPEIIHTTYSNVAYVQVTGRDVFVDFLQLPGYKKDGRVIMNGTRVYMSFFSAKKLAEVLQNTLENVYAEGGMEQYENKNISKNKEK